MDDHTATPRPLDSPGAPRAIGPYSLETLLGRGGMGEVWAARDTRLDRRVAVKQVRAEVGDERARARFRREAWAAARVAHPSIVPVFDVVEDDAGDWIVMEFVDGPTLRQLCEDEPLALAEALRYGRQIAEGLEAAHAEGLVHRDLKTENVMIAPSGHAKILDFGLAKSIGAGHDEATLTVRGEVMGTVRAMSPEQARGLEVDARSDLFSLGTLLYEVLTGATPFAGQTSLDTLSRVVSFEPVPIRELRPDLPAELTRLIEHLLEKAPERRPQTAAEVAARLETLATTHAASTALPRSRQPAGPNDEATLGPGPSPGPGEGLETETGNPETGNPETGNLEAGRHETMDLETLDLETLDLQDTDSPASPRTARRLAAALLAAVLLVAATAWILTRDSAGPPGVLSGQASPESGGSGEGEVDTAGAAEQDAPESVLELRRRAERLLAGYYRPGQIEEAIELLRRASVHEGGNAAVWADLSTAYWRAYWNRGRDDQWRDQALAAARRAVELDPFLSAGHVALGQARSLAGEYSEALESFDQALRLQPANARAQRGRGDVFRRLEEWPSAEAAYLASLELQPSGEVQDSLGSVYYTTGDYGPAEAAFRRSIELDPGRIYPYSNLAAVYHMQGRLADAADQLQRALEIQPSVVLYANLGTLLFYQGLYAEAATAFDNALELGGTDWHVIWANLGDAYRYLPDQERKAEEAYTRAIQLVEKELEKNPDDLGARSRLALYRAKAGQGEEAAEMSATAPTAEDAASAYRFAVALELAGRRQAALDRLAHALDLGFPVKEIERDPDLATLRRDADYHRLLARLQ